MARNTPWNDPEWHESYVALRDVQLGQRIFWLDCLLDVAVDEKSTRAEVRAAQKAYDFAQAAHAALGELQAIMRPEVRELTDAELDGEGEDDGTTLDSPASAPAEAKPSEAGPTLGEYVARCREVLPRNATAKSGYAMWCLERDVPLEKMSAAHAKLAMGPAKRKPGRPRKAAK